MKGCIRFYLPDKRYGFISAEDEHEYFVHFTQVEVKFDPHRMGKNLLEKGDFVEFDIGEAPNGKPMAINVKLLKEFKA